MARFVRYFTMLDRSGHTIYDLFFASNHPLGHLKMKEAMRAVGHGGEFAFRDGVGAGQTALFGEQIPRDVAALVAARFAGRVVDAAEVRAFVLDDTAYVGKDFTAAMRLLESGLPRLGRLTVATTKRDGKTRKAGTFPDGSVITFPPPAA